MLIPAALNVRFLAASILGALSLAAFSQPRIVPLSANGLAYNNRTDKIYAISDSKAAVGFANTLSQIDPESGTVEKTVQVGANPSKVLAGDGGLCVWVVSGDGHLIQQFDAGNLAKTQEFSPGDKNTTVNDLFTITGIPYAVLVQRNNGRGYDVVPFFDGKPKVAPMPVESELVTENPSYRFFGYSTREGPGNCGQYYYFPDSVRPTAKVSPPFHGNVRVSGTPFGVGFTDGGKVFDPETREVLGQINLDGSHCTACDTLRPYVYSLTGHDNDVLVHVLSLQSYADLGTAPLGAGLTGDPANLIRWGKHGFAYTQQGKIVITATNLGPQANSVDLSITRSKAMGDFRPDSTVEYELVVTNNSNVNSSDAIVTDTLPLGVSILDARASSGTVASGSGYIKADLGSVPAHRSTVLDVKVKIGPMRRPTFYAVVRSFDFDPNTLNNMAMPFGMDHNGRSIGVDLVAKWKSLVQRPRGSTLSLKNAVEGSVTISNQGTEASVPCALAFYLQDDEVFVPQFATLLKQVEIPAIGPGDSLTVYLEAPVGDDDNTGEWVIALVDATQVMNVVDRMNCEASRCIEETIPGGLPAPVDPGA